MSYPIPDKALLSHIAILGKAGSGKTTAAKGLVERVLAQAGRACVIDPTGVWHGLRTSADGKRAGFPVVIFGGEHADFPLHSTHGEAIAEIVATSSTPVIIDTSLLRVGERTRFFADFAEALLRKNRGPLHVIVDEAHLFAPQGRVSDPQSGAMLHAANNMVSLGRARGLRITLISQRPAKLHKDSLTQAEMLVAMRLVAPQDRRAIEDWIEDNADEKKAKEILSSLAGLKTGQAWVWAPVLDILERVTFPRITTLDTSAAPEARDDEARRVLAPIDRDAITARLGAIAEETSANDPKKLRARIAELERGTRQIDTSSIETAVKMAEERGYQAGAQQAAINITTRMLQAVEQLDEAHTSVRNAMQAALEQEPQKFTVHAQAKPRPIAEGYPPIKVTVRASNGGGTPGGIDSGGARRRMSIALAQNSEGLSGRKLSILSGVKEGGSTWRGAMAGLRKDGHVQDDGRFFRLTATGLKALGSYEPLPTGEGLLNYWRGKFSGTRLAIFDAILDGRGAPVPAQRVAAEARVDLGGSTWRGHMAKLRGLDLVSGSDELRANEELFA